MLIYKYFFFINGETFVFHTKLEYKNLALYEQIFKTILQITLAITFLINYLMIDVFKVFPLNNKYIYIKTTKNCHNVIFM